MSCSSAEKLSTIVSRLFIHDLAKWQFYNMTQLPFFFEALISASALGPWP
jgi:hypothetical protein